MNYDCRGGHAPANIAKAIAAADDGDILTVANVAQAALARRAAHRMRPTLRLTVIIKEE